MISINEDTLISAIEKVTKNVVNIASVRMVTDELLRIFPIEGVGSGILIDNQGHILTNYHVVDHARRLKVTIYNGKTFNAKVIGTDKLTDLAVLKIEFDSDWVHLRTSNTEPIIRIYAESDFETKANNIALQIMRDIKEFA